MGRVFFPTTSLNRFGVRETDQQATLGAVQRFPAEPTPRAAMTPTGPLLGAVDGLDGELGLMADRMYSNGGGYWGARPPIRVVNFNPPAPPPVTPYLSPQPTPPAQVISASGGGGAAPPSAGSPTVSTQVGPTPTVTLPPPGPSVILVSSGGGTQTPATAPAAAAPASSGIVNGITAWLSGSTSLFNYNVPNALLAGVVVLGFAWLESGSTTRRR